MNRIKLVWSTYDHLQEIISVRAGHHLSKERVHQQSAVSKEEEK